MHNVGLEDAWEDGIWARSGILSPGGSHVSGECTPTGHREASLRLPHIGQNVVLSDPRAYNFCIHVQSPYYDVDGSTDVLYELV